jgi:phosphoribosylamine--glycine ligase
VDTEQKRIVTSGGRVLCAVGMGASVRAAQSEAYGLVKEIRWKGAQYRRDIGHLAVARENAAAR